MALQDYDLSASQSIRIRVVTQDGTIRQRIATMLKGQSLTVREISKALRISEKEVYYHLEHVQRSCGIKNKLISEPARCLDCGFVFRKRSKLSAPGRCPVCRSEAITMPMYGLVSGDHESQD